MAKLRSTSTCSILQTSRCNMPRRIFTEEQREYLAHNGALVAPSGWTMSICLNAGLAYSPEIRPLGEQVFQEYFYAATRESKWIDTSSRLTELSKEESGPPSFEPGDDEET